MTSASKHLEEIILKNNRTSTLQVVFIDIEKYSKRHNLIQIAVIDSFTTCLRQALIETSKEFIGYAQGNNVNFLTDIISLPTGDGAAIVFSFQGLRDIHLFFAKALLKSIYEVNVNNPCDKFNEQGWCNCHRQNFFVRIGISEGRGIIYRDINGDYNVAGAPINIAARVMGLAGRSQIAFTKDAFREITEMADDPFLTEHFVKYSEVGIKHGVKLDVYQYIDQGLGYLNSTPLTFNKSEDQLSSRSGLIEHYREIEEAGFRKIYPDRQKFFDDLFENVFQRVRNELKIMGICVSLFKEADRPQRMGTDWNSNRIVKNLVEIIEKGCTTKILFLKRYPTAEQLKYYGISQEGDFFFMRERDEDRDFDFRGGRRLKIIANLSLGHLIRVIVELARRTQDDDIEGRREILNRIQIREYIALPALSLYIADDEIYVTPYLLKRHCSTVPAFQVGDKTSDLYIAYNAHFEATWKDTLSTTTVIDEAFIELLVKEPKKALELYERKYQEITDQEYIKVREQPEHSGNPDHYRIEEYAITEILKELAV